MFQTFFTKTLESKFIKNLLYNTPLPFYRSVREGDYLFKDIKYVCTGHIIQCLKSGYFGTYKWDKYEYRLCTGLDRVDGPSSNINNFKSHEKYFITFSDYLSGTGSNRLLSNFTNSIECTAENLNEINELIKNKFVCVTGYDASVDGLSAATNYEVVATTDDSYVTLVRNKPQLNQVYRNFITQDPLQIKYD